MDDEYPSLSAIVLVVSSAKPLSAGYLFSLITGARSVVKEIWNHPSIYPLVWMKGDNNW